jgi:hypothetical protein
MLVTLYIAYNNKHDYNTLYNKFKTFFEIAKILIKTNFLILMVCTYLICYNIKINLFSYASSCYPPYQWASQVLRAYNFPLWNQPNTAGARFC